MREFLEQFNGKYVELIYKTLSDKKKMEEKHYIGKLLVSKDYFEIKGPDMVYCYDGFYKYRKEIKLTILKNEVTTTLT